MISSDDKDSERIIEKKFSPDDQNSDSSSDDNKSDSSPDDKISSDSSSDGKKSDSSDDDDKKRDSSDDDKKRDSSDDDDRKRDSSDDDDKKRDSSDDDDDKKRDSSDDDSDTEDISLEKMDDYLEQVGLLGDNQQITKRDTSAAFEKVAKGRKTVTVEQFEEILKDIADSKNLNVEDLKKKLKSVLSEKTVIAMSGASSSGGMSKGKEPKAN